MFQAVSELETVLAPTQIRVWFTTVNERFDYRSAVQLLDDGPVEEAGATVVREAAEFASSRAAVGRG